VRFYASLFSVLLLLVVGVASAEPSAARLNATQLTTKFKAATGEKLKLNTRSSYPGHFKAYDLGVATIANRGRWGTFTVYLVTGPDVEAEVTDLLADGHTGVLETPTAGGIYWERGATLYGDRYWLAKKRYGSNVVLWWTTTSEAKKTDATFKRLHAALRKVTR
jgi:hypothetical protein